MARIGLNTFIQGLTGKLIIRWVKASAPLAEVDRLPAKDFPYDGVDNLLNLDPVVYIVQWWRSDNGVSLDQLIKDWAIDASIYNEATVKTYQYVTDRGDGDSGIWADPISPETILTDTRLDGATQDDLIVHEVGYGNHINADYQLVAGGGIELLNGFVFNPGAPWTITRTQIVAISSGPGDSGSNSRFAGVAVLDTDRDFYTDPTDNLYNKLVIANWATTVGKVIFGDLSLIPDNTHVTFQTERGMQNYLQLQFNPGDTVRYMNADVNVIYLPKCETISLFFFAGVCYVTEVPKRALQRGQLLIDYSATRSADTKACLPADEATGLLNATDYPGIYAWLQTLTTGVVPLGAGVGQWSYNTAGVFPNKRNFGIDVGAGTFRVPHLAGIFIKLGTTSGVYETDTIGPHSINLVPYYVYGNQGKGNLGSGSQDAVARTDPNRSSTINVNAGTGIGTETKPKNFTQIPYIIL